jgi:hypothetical protein
MQTIYTFLNRLRKLIFIGAFRILTDIQITEFIVHCTSWLQIFVFCNITFERVKYGGRLIKEGMLNCQVLLRVFVPFYYKIGVAIKLS